MERVKKGEVYWFISLTTGYGDNGISVDWDYETSQPIDNKKWAEGNYFHTREGAESIASKIRAVLKGADVIEMPSEEEIRERLNMIIPTQPVEPWCVEGYCKHIIGFIKSKIVK